jgi:DNA repair protein RecO (recombination protein O)
MLHKTRGIVFRVTEYSETSLVASVYTELFGLRSYLLSGAKRKKSKTSPALFQPLSLLDLVVYEKTTRGLQRISEVKSACPYTEIPSDPVKTSLLFFLNEALAKSVREEEANPSLFEYIFSALVMLDTTRESCANFHLVFLLGLSRHLGFFPQTGYSASSPFFDLKEGIYISRLPAHPHVLQEPQSGLFFSMANTVLADSHLVKISSGQRRELLDALLEYYALHLSGFTPPRSHRVLEEVLK